MARETAYQRRTGPAAQARVQAEHPDWSSTQIRQYLRGHGRTAEARLDVLDEQGRKVPRGGKGTWYEVNRSGDIKFALDRAVKDHGEQVRVEVVVFTKDNPDGYVLLKDNEGRSSRYQGIRAEFLAKQLHEHPKFEAGITDLTTSYGKQKITGVLRASVRFVSSGKSAQQEGAA